MPKVKEINGYPLEEKQASGRMYPDTFNRRVAWLSEHGATELDVELGEEGVEYITLEDEDDGAPEMVELPEDLRMEEIHA